MRRRQGKLISNLPQATGRPQREPILYICDFSRGGLNTRLHTLVSKPCSEATNIGDRLSLLADCGCWYKIRIGNFDNVGECQYAVPSYWDIGKVYKHLIKQVALEKKIDVVDAIIEAYHSFFFRRLHTI